MNKRIVNIELVRRRNKETIAYGHDVLLITADLGIAKKPETKKVAENLPLPVARREAFKARDQEVAIGKTKREDIQIWEEIGPGPDDWRRI